MVVLIVRIERFDNIIVLICIAAKEEMNDLEAKLQKKLRGARFRMLNEQLYTISSEVQLYVKYFFVVISIQNFI